MLDKLDQIFKHQEELQITLGMMDKIHNSPEMNQQFMNQTFLAIHEEVVEIMKETQYKQIGVVPFGWKKSQIFKRSEYKNEIADLLHFVVNLCIAAKISSQELYESYIIKNKVNIERHDNGY